jgi:hypothetical protein
MFTSVDFHVQVSWRGVTYDKSFWLKSEKACRFATRRCRRLAEWCAVSDTKFGINPSEAGWVHQFNIDAKKSILAHIYPCLARHGERVARNKQHRLPAVSSSSCKHGHVQRRRALFGLHAEEVGAASYGGVANSALLLLHPEADGNCTLPLLHPEADESDNRHDQHRETCDASKAVQSVGCILLVHLVLRHGKPVCW